MSAAGLDNANANSNNIIFSVEDTKLYVPVATLSARENQKARIKMQEIKLGIFLNQVLLESIDCLL